MSFSLPLPLTQILCCIAFVSLGSLLQAVTGLGGGLIIVPLLAFVSTEFLPGPLVFASTSLALSMAVMGRQHIDFKNMRPILLGLIIGTVVAAMYISALPADKLGLVFGIFILLAVAVSYKTPKFAFNWQGGFLSGAMSGFSGTSSGMGAPFLALLYQHHAGPSLRATLAFLYFVSAVMIVICLHFAGKFGTHELELGLYLIPGFVLGYFISPLLAKYIDKGLARPAVLILSTASAVILIWRSV